VYLGLENPTAGRQQILAQFKDLVGKSGHRILEGRSRSEKASIKEDLEKCGRFLRRIRKIDVRGIVLFSCSKRDMFETVGVAKPFRPHLVVSRKPAVAPLIATLDDFKRIAVCIVDRREARLFEYFMDRMEEVKAFVDDVPARVRVGGWSGYEESRIARHVGVHEYDHLKNVAEALFEQFKLRGFDWLFLSVRGGLREPLESSLHTYVRDRLKGYIEATSKTSADRIRKKTRDLAERLKAEGNLRTVERLVVAAKSAGLAVTGVSRTLKALNAAAVRRLVVADSLVHKGVACRACGFMGIRSSQCPVCGESLSRSENVIDIAEEAAAEQGAEIRHISGRTSLDNHGGIGAFLRFPLDSAASAGAGKRRRSAS
jgi:peptide subunit release factor 1 (eRF1)